MVSATVPATPAKAAPSDPAKPAVSPPDPAKGPALDEGTPKCWVLLDAASLVLVFVVFLVFINRPQILLDTVTRNLSGNWTVTFRVNNMHYPVASSLTMVVVIFYDGQPVQALSSPLTLAQVHAVEVAQGATAYKVSLPVQSTALTRGNFTVAVGGMGKFKSYTIGKGVLRCVQARVTVDDFNSLQVFMPTRCSWLHLATGARMHPHTGWCGWCERGETVASFAELIAAPVGTVFLLEAKIYFPCCDIIIN